MKFLFLVLTSMTFQYKYFNFSHINKANNIYDK